MTDPHITAAEIYGPAIDAVIAAAGASAFEARAALEAVAPMTAAGIEPATPEIIAAAVAAVEPAHFWRGDRIRFTGRSEIIHGGEFYEAELLEGHRKGERIVTAHGPAWNHATQRNEDGPRGQ